jgi:hypothetical protein
MALETIRFCRPYSVIICSFRISKSAGGSEPRPSNRLPKEVFGWLLSRRFYLLYWLWNESPNIQI